MFTSLKTKKLQMMQVISTMAIAIATYAMGTIGADCTFVIYEPKMPEALKNEMNK
ncbi:cyclic lactone autoinducer peptide [Enterococcus mundtii]|uniref:cyclic lactone autoinducer peptide n=1 Tax=Enterococcus TaxID=1350 RepID=UPI000555F92B|nr:MULTISPECIES: cyclic lactone autoinducer peptide [Enterococcus]AZP92900.1 cyclic lactone autoinducer peptide [Enterococcus mundtii]MDA9428427.1 hypothetical protein [Enterococcus mundtii 1A]MDK4210891.1 cyclic lactone autoinducer peptide [Enterococcus mundtii]MDO7877856.1 cyclic lactone autoinducer peptide [Enterococcus mundtii]MEC3940144.1 cyclic lactone autoinducer peptide [Enterococcus mundtii]